MPIGFAIFITAVIVSVVVLLIYHYAILGPTGGLVSATNQGYNYNENIQYINARLGSMFPPTNYNPPPLPEVNDEVYAPYP